MVVLEYVRMLGPVHDSVDKKIDRRKGKSIVKKLSQGTFKIENPNTHPSSGSAKFALQESI